MPNIRLDFEKHQILVEARIYCRKKHISFGKLVQMSDRDLERDPDMTAKLLQGLRMLRRKPITRPTTEWSAKANIYCTPTHAAITHELYNDG